MLESLNFLGLPFCPHKPLKPFSLYCLCQPAIVDGCLILKCFAISKKDKPFICLYSNTDN